MSESTIPAICSQHVITFPREFSFQLFLSQTFLPIREWALGSALFRYALPSRWLKPVYASFTYELQTVSNCLLHTTHVHAYLYVPTCHVCKRDSRTRRTRDSCWWWDAIHRIRFGVVLLEWSSTTRCLSNNIVACSLFDARTCCSINSPSRWNDRDVASFLLALDREWIVDKLKERKKRRETKIIQIISWDWYNLNRNQWWDVYAKGCRTLREKRRLNRIKKKGFCEQLEARFAAADNEFIGLPHCVAHRCNLTRSIPTVDFTRPRSQP